MDRTAVVRLRRAIIGATAASTLIVAAAAPATAHEPHQAAHAHQGAGQVIANGQNHPRFKDLDGDGRMESCESYGPLPTETRIGPSWYGIETAHHGPDSGDPGKGDGCYETDSTPTADVANTAIR